MEIKYAYSILKLFYFGLFFTFFMGTHRLNSQTPLPGMSIQAFSPKEENLLKPMNDMMERIYQLKMTGDFDHDYAAIMNEHRISGNDLCKVYIMSGPESLLIPTAKLTAAGLQQDQKTLKVFLNKYKTQPQQVQHNDLMEVLNKMMSHMKNKIYAEDNDLDYAYMMTLYHQAGIELSEAELEYGNNAELKDMAVKMLDEHSKSLTDLIDWQSQMIVRVPE